MGLPPKSSILIGFKPLFSPSFLGYKVPIFGTHPPFPVSGPRPSCWAVSMAHGGSEHDKSRNRLPSDKCHGEQSCRVYTTQPQQVHPGRLTWNLKMMVWKMIFLSKWVICRFHVNLPGCIGKFWWFWWFTLGCWEWLSSSRKKPIHRKLVNVLLMPCCCVFFSLVTEGGGSRNSTIFFKMSQGSQQLVACLQIQEWYSQKIYLSALCLSAPDAVCCPPLRCHPHPRCIFLARTEDKTFLANATCIGSHPIEVGLEKS